MTDDPFTQAYDAVVAVLNAHTGFSSLVRPANRITYTGKTIPWTKESLQPGDVPEWELRPSGGTTTQTNTGWFAEQNLDLRLKASTMDLRRQYFPLKWQVHKAMFAAGSGLGTDLIRKCEILDITEGLADSPEIDQSEQGWHGVVRIRLTIVLSRSILLE